MHQNTLWFLNIPDLSFIPSPSCSVALQIPNKLIIYDTYARQQLLAELLQKIKEPVAVITSPILYNDWKDFQNSCKVVTVKQLTRRYILQHRFSTNLTTTLRKQNTDETYIIDAGVFANASAFEFTFLCALPNRKITLVENSFISTKRFLNLDVLSLLTNMMPYSRKRTVDLLIFPTLPNDIIKAAYHYHARKPKPKQKNATVHIHKISTDKMTSKFSALQLNDIGFHVPTIFNKVVESRSTTVCTICANDNAETMSKILPCNHILCYHCIHRVKSCPYCRGPIQSVETKITKPENSKLDLLLGFLATDVSPIGLKIIIICEHIKITTQLAYYLNNFTSYTCKKMSAKIAKKLPNILIIKSKQLLGQEFDAQRVVLWHPIPNMRIKEHIQCAHIHHFLYANTIEDNS